jgi:antitoxin VapB
MRRISRENLLQEIDTKVHRINELLETRNLEGLLFLRRENVAWLTAGESSRTIAMPGEIAIACLLILKDGRRFYFAANNEAVRLAHEDLSELGFEPIVYPWYEDLSERLIRSVAGGGKLGSDFLRAECELTNIAPLRWELLPAEISRYRDLCHKTARAVARVLLELRPATNMREVEARVCYELQCDGIEPTVLLMAADERIRRYKHALTQDSTVDRFAMINLCARRWGLAVSITRYLHFGAMSEELIRDFDVSSQVYARLLHATRTGFTSAECFDVARRAYADQGYPGEEKEHHQGGAAGYLEREWLARPGGKEVICSPQAFAWNPSVRGAKIEDTVLLQDGQIEVMTATPELPIVGIEVVGNTYKLPGVLVR